MRVTDDLWKSSNQLLHDILVWWHGFNYYFKIYILYELYWNKTENLNWTEFKTISFRTTSQQVVSRLPKFAAILRNDCKKKQKIS